MSILQFFHMYKSYTFSSSSTALKPTQDNTINLSMLSLNQSQDETIQREIDIYTGKLEQQKRKFFSIQDAYKDTHKEYELFKQKLHEVKRLSQTSESAMGHARMKNLKGNFDKMRISYDDAMAYNYKLKTEIDKLRKDKKILLNLQNGYMDEINRKEDMFEEKMRLINEKKQRNEDILMEIDHIRTVNEDEKEECNRKIGNIENEYSESKKMREMSKTNDKTQKAEIIDTHPVLKLRLKKIISKNKETVKSLDKYQKHLALIEKAFNEIKEGSGVTDLDEITDTFIKADEQNASLYKYADTISRKINHLESYNKALAQRIQEEEKINYTKREMMSNPTDVELRNQQTEVHLKKKEEFINNFNVLLANISPELEKALTYLAKSKWNSEETKSEDYQFGFNITDLTIEGYLSDLEKFANSIVEVYHLRSHKAGSLAEQYNHENGKYSSAPGYSIQEWKEDKDLLAEKDFKRFAEDYLEKKRYKNRE